MKNTFLSIIIIVAAIAAIWFSSQYHLSVIRCKSTVSEINQNLLILEQEIFELKQMMGAENE